MNLRAPLLLGPAALALGCSPSGQAIPPNLLLVSLDTLRADRVGAYGYDRDTTPVLDSLAAEGVVFERVAAPSSRTASSHMSVLTGLRPSSHGVVNYVSENGLAASADLPLLTELLEDAGYTTAGFSGGGMMRGELGFARGFEIYDHRGGGAEPVFTRAEAWLRERNPDEVPFFLFVHTYEIHDPYTPPLEWQERFSPNYQGRMNQAGQIEIRGDDRTAAEHLTEFATKRKAFWAGFDPGKRTDLDHVSNLYDAGVAYTDHLLGELYGVVRELGLVDDTLTVVMSDHGEAFMEHGFISHRTIHQEILEVPLVLRLPGAEFAGTRIERQIEGIDLFPSVLDLLGIDVPEHVQAVSFVPDLLGEEQPPALAWSELAETATGDAAVRSADWKLIEKPDQPGTGALFDLARDPGERRNLLESEGEVSRELREHLTRMAAENRDLRRRFAPRTIRMDAQGLKELAELGYADDPTDGSQQD